MQKFEKIRECKISILKLYVRSSIYGISFETSALEGPLTSINPLHLRRDINFFNIFGLVLGPRGRLIEHDAFLVLLSFLAKMQLPCPADENFLSDRFRSRFTCDV